MNKLRFADNDLAVRWRRQFKQLGKGVHMPIKDKKQLFVTMLSHLRQGTERMNQAYQEFGQAAQNPQVKEALESRAFISEGILERLDRCFKLIYAQPVK